VGGRDLRLPLALAALLPASACSPEAAPAPANAQDAASEAAPSAPEAPRAEAKAAAAPAKPASARRCGWLVNPTPGNWWLTDAEGQWVLASQGSEPPTGMDEMPDMSIAGWVETNGHYGHGCACLTITYDPATEQVTRVADAQPKPLKQCRADKRLPRP
jgi:hypothetical protein